MLSYTVSVFEEGSNSMYRSRWRAKVPKSVTASPRLMPSSFALGLIPTHTKRNHSIPHLVVPPEL